jgi:H+/Cl- antiporter ClcA
MAASAARRARSSALTRGATAALALVAALVGILGVVIPWRHSGQDDVSAAVQDGPALLLQPLPLRVLPLRAASVTVASQPSGARIVLLPDGASLGAEPVQVLVPEGDVARLRVTLDGFRDRDVDLAYADAARSPKVLVELTPR